MTQTHVLIFRLTLPINWLCGKTKLLMYSKVGDGNLRCAPTCCTGRNRALKGAPSLWKIVGSGIAPQSSIEALRCFCLRYLPGGRGTRQGRLMKHARGQRWVTCLTLPPPPFL